MEELQQITMDEYLGLKNEIKTRITTIVKSFVRIGETLCKIDQTQAYRLDGYKSVAEMAKAEYDMTPSGVTRFMGVYRKYCTGGQLKEGYENYSYAQLVEMMQLPEEDEELIRPDTQRETIRELKKFNREGENDPYTLEHWQNQTPEEEENRQILGELLTAMFKPESQREIFANICDEVKDGISAEQFAEMLNPGGNRTVRSGRAMAFFYENEVKIKIWSRPTPVKMTYEEVIEVFKTKFEANLRDEEINYESEKETDGDFTGAGDTETDHEEADQAGTQEVQTQIAPAQESEEEENTVNPVSESDFEDQEEKLEEKKDHIGKITEMVQKSSGQQEEDQIPGQDNVMNHPELLPEGMQPTTSATINGHEQEATVEPTSAQRVEECLSLLSSIQGNIALNNYKAALPQAQKLVEYLEALI